MNRVVDVGVLIVGVAALLVLTRPGSQGSKLVDAIGGAFAGALGVATGQAVTTGGVRSKPAYRAGTRTRTRQRA